MFESNLGLESRTEEELARPSQDVRSSSQSHNLETLHNSDPPQGGIQHVGVSERDVQRDRGVVRQSHSLLTPKSSPAPRSFVTPAHKASHLPTPQSPSNLSYSLEYGLDSPVRHGSSQGRPSSSSSRTHDRGRDAPSGSFPTPESSPMYARRPRSSHNPSTPSPPRTPRPGSSRRTLQTNADTVSNPPTPPPRSLNSSPPLRSTLSSPFVDRSAQRTPTHSRARTPPRPQSHQSSPDTSPMVVDDVFSPVPSTSTIKSTPSLKAPVPTRPVGGDVDRIRLQLAEDQVALHDDTETRRPEYLKRTKRPLSDVDPDADYMGSVALLGSTSSGAVNAGVTESPVKGRRIALFQETSEESFEQSLLAGGYPRYGDLPAYTDPQTPQNNNKGKGVMSQRAMDWLHHGTPARTMPNGTEESEQERATPSEKEMRKRRRLAAFEESHHEMPTNGKLVAVEMEGKGRVLMDKRLDDRPSSPLIESPAAAKKRGGRKKKGQVVSVGPVKRGVGRGVAADENVAEGEEMQRPDWPDSEFPWSMRAKERDEWTRREHEEKMKWIERFLDRDSDESEEEDQSLEIPVPDDEDDEMPFPSTQPPRPGRGKMVPLKANPDARPSDPQERILIPSDPADARAVLWSKRYVRSLAYRRRHQDSDDDMVLADDQEVRCVCDGRGEGNVVQCDDCGVWYHFACIGIKDSSELGRREDLWFCRDCLEEEMPVEEPSSEPTFAPTDDQPLQRKRRDPLMSLGSSGLSPANSWPSAQRVPKTPVRGRDVRDAYSSSSWDASSSSRAGPTTPSHARTFHSPAIYDTSSGDVPVTPHRSTRFGEPFTTPKMSSSTPWGTRSFQTPSRPKRSGGPLPFQFDDSAGYRTGLAYAYDDDTPIRRSKPLEELPNPAYSYASGSRSLPRHMVDSPLGARSKVITYPLGMPESPTAGKSTSRKAKGGRAAPKTP